MLRLFISFFKKISVIDLLEMCPLSLYSLWCPLQKHAYSNILKILLPKNWKFSDKNLRYFHISAQNIDCGYSLEPPRRGGSNEYPQSMFWAELRKIMYIPVNPSFTIEKRGLRGSKLYRHVFVMSYRAWLFNYFFLSNTMRALGYKFLKLLE